jgi:hypothetical protein
MTGWWWTLARAKTTARAEADSSAALRNDNKKGIGSAALRNDNKNGQMHELWQLVFADC